MYRRSGTRSIPSFVAWAASASIGESAKLLAVAEPNNVAFDIPMLLGRDFNDLRQVMQRWPFPVVAGPADANKPRIRFNPGQPTQKGFTPVELASLIIGELKRTAEAALGEPVSQAVLSVPAGSTDATRQAMKHAARKAGLRAKGRPGPPSHRQRAHRSRNRRWFRRREQSVVCDVGAHSLDLTLLEVEDSMMDVLATRRLGFGGSDLDSRLIEHCAAIFQGQYQVDCRGSPAALCLLREACQRAKEALSSEAFASVNVGALLHGKDFECDISRASGDSFEGLCRGD
jgi:molecular chaperone DnaK (HSP70)